MYTDLFVPAQGIYLLNHSVGRMPSSTREIAEAHFFDAWENGSPDAWSRWMGVFDQFRQALAHLFNSQAACFCPQPNISSAIAKYIGSLPQATERKQILLSENDFPSVGFALKQAEKRGYQLRFIGKHQNVLDSQVWQAAMTEQVHSVLISHVHYNTSKMTPVADITAHARKLGIFSIVDIAQSSGVVPIDFAKWQANMIVGSCVKWLCGGPGAGFVWLDPDSIASIEPMDVGWFSHQNPFAFDIHDFTYADDANRFWGGTPSVLPYVIATNSIKQMLNIGIEKVRAHNQAMISKMIAAISTEYLASPLAPAQRGGTLVLKFKQQAQVQKALENVGVHFDVRPLGMRLSPHIYNSEQEIDTVIDCFIND